MDRWKEKLCLEHTWYLYLCVFLLLAFISWQQFLIADLQERMMNVEASRYDDQLNNIEWAATLALEQNKEYLFSAEIQRGLSVPHHGAGMGCV